MSGPKLQSLSSLKVTPQYTLHYVHSQLQWSIVSEGTDSSLEQLSVHKDLLLKNRPLLIVDSIMLNRLMKAQGEILFS